MSYNNIDENYRAVKGSFSKSSSDCGSVLDIDAISLQMFLVHALYSGQGL